jgi:DNA-binding SARP family transcriptional activator
MSSVPQPLQPAVWKLELFGRGQLICADLVVQLERKTAALFAFLALEGATSRSKLAGLLWADSTEDAARSSLRQRLYRLRASVGFDLIVSDEPLRLESSLEIDTVRFESFIFTSEHIKALELEGELLAGNDYDDCPDLNDWVLAARERLESGRREALSSEANRLETAGDYQKALGRAQQLLARDPISEDSHRRVMRLHYLAGNRPAAIRAFEHCKTILEVQLGVEPLLETQNLAKLISVGDHLPQTTLPTRVNIPIQVLRPPILAGRTREWAQLEQAWEAGLGVIVRGEPGVGKTRLMLDFVGSQGAYVLLEGRPGDEGIPYATLSRGLKRILEQHIELKLEKRQRQELSRILPELEQDAPPAIRSDAEKLRFFEAIVKLFGQLVTLKVQTIVADDLQFMDSASLEVWQYITAQFALKNNEQVVLHTCCGFRTAELEANLETSLLRATQDGIATLIEIKSLETDGLVSLLHGLKLPGVTELAVSLEQYTGGNPMYVLETLKSLLETGGVERGLPQHFPPPRKVGILIQHRLERLSPNALRVAQVAAVAETDFTLELAAKILEVGTLELTQPLQELERAQVLVGMRFAHDLIFEATLEGIPTSIQNFVHRNIALYLENNNANSASIARHYLKAGQEDKAIPFLLESARLSATNFQLREATAFFERAATALENQGLRPQAFQALSEARKLLAKAEVSEHLEEMIHKLSSLATTPTEKALVALARAEMFYQKGDMPNAERAASEGCKLSFEHDKKLYFELLAFVAGALAEQNKLSKASELFEQCLAFFLEQNDQPMVQHALGNVAYIYGMQGRRIDANQKLEQQFEIAFKLNDLEYQATSLNGLMFNCLLLGLLDEGLQKGNQALEIYNRLDGQDYERCRTLTHIGNCARDLNNYTHALERTQEAIVLSQQTNLPNAYVYRAKAATLIQLGDIEAAQKLLQSTLQDPRLTVSDIRSLEMTSLFSQVAETKEFERQLDKVGGLVKNQSPFGECRFLLEGARVPSQLALARIEQALEIIKQHGFSVLSIIAHSRKGLALLWLGQVIEALNASTAATELLKTHTPADFYKGEVYLSHYQILKATKKKSANAYLEQTLRWLLEVADNHVPPEYRNSFLTCNPVNAAILEAARHANLELPNSVTLQ